MKILYKIATMTCLSVLCSGFMSTTGCTGTNVSVTPALGPETTKLLQDQKDQIEKQKEQIVDLQKKDNDRKQQLDKVAGNAYGIDVGTAHIKEDSKGKDIVIAENGLIKKIVGDPSPDERSKADARTISILQNDLQKQKELYGQANTEIENLKNDVKLKDQSITERDNIIKSKDQALIEQDKKHQTEVAKNAKDAQAIYNKLKQDNTDLQKYYEDKERAIWINVLRFGGFGIILLGVAALAITEGRALGPGLILIGSGSLIILIGVAINIVIMQTWFPYAAFAVGLLTLGGIGWASFHFFKNHKTDGQLTALLNDMQTEAETLASKGDEESKILLKKLEEHATYRLGSIDKLKSLFTKSGLDEKQKPL